MKTLKNILITAAIVLTSVSAFAVGNTGAPAGIAATVTITGGSPLTLLTNNVTIFSLQVLATNTTFVNFYDCGTTNLPYSGTNYVTAAYAVPVGYATNISTSFVGYNGYTNYYTNSAWVTINTTNAASTNNLPPVGSFAGVNNVLCSYNPEMLFAQGVSVYCPQTVTLIYYYRPNR